MVRKRGIPKRGRVGTLLQGRRWELRPTRDRSWHAAGLRLNSGRARMVRLRAVCKPFLPLTEVARTFALVPLPVGGMRRLLLFLALSKVELPQCKSVFGITEVVRLPLGPQRRLT